MLPDPDAGDLTRFHLAVADRVREARLWRNLTQERLSHASDVPVRTLVALESGRTGVRLDTLWRIARAMDMPLSDLVREPDAS